MSSDANKALVQRLVKDVQEGGQLALVDELFADDFVDHTPFPGVPPTRDGVRMLFAGFREAFPDLKVTIDEQVAEGEKVVTRKTFEGTHRGSFMGIPPTGNPIAFSVIDILTVRGGRFREHRVVVDQLHLLRQLGAMPA
jgi:steroid delta-isomerase-like uncharacterized protein